MSLPDSFSGRKLLSDRYRARKAEGQATFGAEAYIFLAGCIGGAGTAGCADGATDQCSCASTRDGANQRTATGSAAYPCEVAALMGGACDHDA